TRQLTGDYETQLLAARRWRNDWHFRIGVHHLRGLISATTAGRQYAAIADATLAALWPQVVAEFARKHGAPPGRGAVILGMGSLGAETLAATSDLDLIVIYDPLDQTASTGPRPLETRPYYARLTQAFITALTAPMGPGRLYEVDMRLRPSGRQGPVATSLDSFRTYQSEEAWTWEHLALTRARPVAGAPEIAEDVEAFRQTLLQRRRDRSATLKDVTDMRARLAAAKPGAAWDAKAGTGRLQDIELFAQTGALLAGSPARRTLQQIEAGAETLSLETTDLVAAHDLFQTVQIAARLLIGGPFDPDAVGEGGRDFLLRETGTPDLATLESRLQSCAGSVDEIVTKALRDD
ncbi:MAG: glutamine-synthetase adenylyltransferase, partial [Pseudomonadota bacterium]